MLLLSRVSPPCPALLTTQLSPKLHSFVSYLTLQSPINTGFSGHCWGYVGGPIFCLTSTPKISKKRGRYQNKTWSYPAIVSTRISSMLYFFDFSFLAYKCLLMTSDYQQNIKIELAKVILSRITNEVSVLIQKI